MIAIFIIALVLVFGFVIFFGAPYVPTLNKTQDIALDLLDLKPGQTLIDLGSGDGILLKKAAQRGLNGVGYEINPVLVLISRIMTWRYRKQVKIVWDNFWTARWPKHDGIYVFLRASYMVKLDKKIKDQSKKGTLLASNAFEIPGKKHSLKKDSIFLYNY